jgi:hypothetical protein
VNSSNQQEAILKTASGDLNTPHAIPCMFGGLEGKILTLQFEEQPMVSGPVSIEYNDTLFLGEIVRFSASGNGTSEMHVKVEQMLTGLQSLLRFRAQLLGEGVGPTPERTSAPELKICA